MNGVTMTCVDTMQEFILQFLHQNFCSIIIMCLGTALIFVLVTKLSVIATLIIPLTHVVSGAARTRSCTLTVLSSNRAP